METKEYKYKGKVYITKAGVVKQYEQTKKYTPRHKKFDDLLHDEEVSKILKDRTMNMTDKVDLIFTISQDRFKDNKWSRTQISNFTYRNGERKI